MKQAVFSRKMDKVVRHMARKHAITKHRLLNYGGAIGFEFQERIKGLRNAENFDALFDDYINERK